MTAKALHVMNVTSLSLFAHKCTACGELNVDGFWNQLKKKIDRKKLRAYVTRECLECGAVSRKSYRLTTGNRTSSRLTNWIGWFYRLSPYIPTSIWIKVVDLVLWLESRFPI